MANDCECRLTITGDTEDIRDFKTAAATRFDPFSFQKLVPKDRLDDGEYQRHEYADGVAEKIATDHCLKYSFCTAWAPPIRILLAVSELHPSLRIHLEFYDINGGYFGDALFIGGEIAFVDRGEIPPEGDFWTQPYQNDNEIFGLEPDAGEKQSKKMPKNDGNDDGLTELPF